MLKADYNRAPLLVPDGNPLSERHGRMLWRAVSIAVSGGKSPPENRLSPQVGDVGMVVDAYLP